MDTHLVMPPPEFMQRLAALVPLPRLHLIRFGVGASLPDSGSILRFPALAAFQRDVKRSQEVSWAGGNKKPQSYQ